MSNASPAPNKPTIALNRSQTVESPTKANTSEQRPPLDSASSSSFSAQIVYTTPRNTTPSLPSSPLSPPPPSFHDDELSQEIDAVLAKRQSKGWHKLSPRAVIHAVRSREDEDGGQGSSRNLEEGRRLERENRERIRKRPDHSRKTTDASVKLDKHVADDRTGKDGEDVDEKVLYRYAYVYENQRGWARFGALKFSSRALKLFFHYSDPAPFTKFEDESGHLVQVNLPYVNLEDVQLPSPEWAWHGTEWLIDMAGDGMTSHEGYQYSTSFRSSSSGWKPIPPPWHTYLLTCCRRRRWLRLMIYLPSMIAPDSSGAYRQPGHVPEASVPVSPLPISASKAEMGEETESRSRTPSTVQDPSAPNLFLNSAQTPRSPLSPRTQVDLDDVWHSNSSDWDRCHAALKSLKSDGRRLELWTAWLGDLGEQEEDITGMARASLERRRRETGKGRASKEFAEMGKRRGVQWTEDHFAPGHRQDTAGPSISHLLSDEPLPVGGSAPREAVARVLRSHAQEILASFVYPDSRAKFHDMLRRCGLLDELPGNLSFSISTDFRERLDLGTP